MLDRLARRVEVRTAEIRGEPSSLPADDAPADDTAADGNPDPVLAPPPADHTPAWGRLAELSARFDGTLEPVVEGATADGVSGEAVDEISDGDAVETVPAVVAATEQPEGELFSPHSDLGATDAESNDSDPSDDVQLGSSTESGDDATQIDGDAATGVGDAGNVGGDPDDDGLLLASDGVIAAEAGADSVPAIGEPPMFETAVAETSDDEGDHAIADGVGTNTEIVLSAAAERLAAPTDDRVESPLAGLEALGRVLDGDDSDQAAGNTLDQNPVVTTSTDEHGSIETSGEVAAAVALTDEGWTDWSPDATPAQPPRPSADGQEPDDDSDSDDDDDVDEPGVHHGPRWYRKRIRQFGVVAGLVPMVVLGGAAALALASRSGALGGQIGLLLGTAAAPGLLVAGAPFANSNTYPYAAVGSIPFWLLLGWVARRRTLRRPVADWRDYATQLAWLTVAVILGAAAAIAIAAVRIGGPLLG